MDLNGSIALVTGGSEGIGLAIAKALKDEGSHVTITGRREEVLRAAAEQLGVDYIVGDVGLEADAVRTVKTNTSKWVHEEIIPLRDFSWQESYAAFSVSKSVLPDVVSYIKQQEEHHRARSYIDELRALLEKHGVEFQERHLV